MTLHPVDIVIFILFFLVVVSLALWKRRKDESSESYFLAGRNLPWWIIGVSIVAANISTEQFVGMAGQGAGSVGLAVSGWQLIGVISIILVAFFFLPRFLRAGIYTMPEYLEYRYSPFARALMSLSMVIIYSCVTIVAVLYSGGLTLQTIFGIPLNQAIWGIAFIAAIYTTWGGLSSVAWADLVQGGALLIGGLITFFIGLNAVGGWSSFVSHNPEKLHMLLPLDHPELPWTVLIGGMWIPNLYYTGLNQFIVQRTLAAKNLRQGQFGIIFAAALWILVPFAIVIPGIISHQLYGNQLGGTDQAYPMLIRNLIPIGLRGFIFAAISGAVISSLASMLNSASTIFTLDLYARYLKPKSSQKRQVAIGRIMTLVFLFIGCFLAPYLIDPRFKGVFSFIQEFQGYISPGIVTVFIFGFIFRRAPAMAGEAALLLSAPIYGLFHWLYPAVPYLHRMLWTFGILNLIMLGITLWKPLSAPVRLPVKQDFKSFPELGVLIPGILVILLVLAFFVVFR